MTTGGRRQLGFGMFLVLVCLLLAPPAQATGKWPLTPGALVTDAPVSQIATLGDRTYLSGFFSYIGTFNGSGLAASAATGRLARGFPQVNGLISYVLAAPGGGWYIAGDFDEVGGVPRAGVARLDANGRLDRRFNAHVSGLVDALALNGGRLYVGGDFSYIDGLARDGLAAVDARTGGLLSFQAPIDDPTTELAFGPGRAGRPAALYVGATRVLALNPVTGAPLHAFRARIADDISALAVGDGHVYVGGATGLTALDPVTGARDLAFTPKPVSADGSLNFRGQIDVVVVQPHRLLVGGEFNAVGGGGGPLAALDPNTGQANRSFAPAIKGVIYDMDQVGNTLWIGGDFSQVNHHAADNLASLNATTGASKVTAGPSLNGVVNAVRVSDGRIYAGGDFDQLDRLAVDGFAELVNGRLDRRFTPPAPQSQNITADPDALLAADNQFQGYDGTRGVGPPFYTETTDPLQLLSPVTGRTLRGRSPGVVSDLSGAAVSGGELYLDQRVGDDARFPGNRLSVFALQTGRLLRRFDLPFPGYVSQLAVINGAIYVAGSFRRTRPDGQPANLAILKFNALTGAFDAGFDPHANGPVYSIVGAGGEIYFAGLFNTVGELTRRGLAAVSETSGAVDPSFDPKVPPTYGATLTPVNGSVYFNTNDLIENGSSVPNRFLSYGTGASAAFAAPQGIASADITAVAPKPDGVVIAAAMEMPLQADYSADLNFVETLPAR